MQNLLIAAALALTASAAHGQQAQPVSIPLSDARNIGANSVRFGAAQDTGSSPSIVLFGLTKEAWPRIRDALHQAVAEGYPVRAVFLGPTNVPPSLEVYAQGHQVAVGGINPNTLTGPELIRLIRDVHREYYARR